MCYSFSIMKKIFFFHLQSNIAAFLKNYFHLITISPLLPLLILFSAGVVWQHYALTSLFIISLFFVSFLYALHQYTIAQSFMWSALYCLIAISGGLLYQKELADYDAFYCFTHNRPVTITGTIEDLNETTIGHKKTTVITLAVQQIQNDQTVKKFNKYILLYTTNKHTMQISDTVTISHVVCKKAKNEQLMHYQIREQVIATIFADKPAYIIINHPTWTMKRCIFEQKQKILQQCKKKLSPLTFLFFTSFFLGNRQYVKNSLEDTNEQFKRWGIFHFLSRSGLHLALFVITWQNILKYIPFSFVFKNIALIVLSVIYALLSWSNPPFIRSLCLFLLNKTCLITKHSYNLFHYLTLTCFCFLLYCPLYLFFLDFQLTFGITFVLAWFNQLHSQYLHEQYPSQQSNY